MNCISSYMSPLGEMVLTSADGKLNGLWFAGQKYFGSTLQGDEAEAEDSVIIQTKDWLDRYFAGEEPGERPPLAISGSPMRQAVMKIMLGIPYGHTMTYGQIAEEAARMLGKERMSAQAAGGAVGHNPISILVPCHRVVGAKGQLTGYAGGLERKQALLALEGSSTR